MKNKYSSDELRFSLPDYISGRINDKDLSDEIEKMISSDPEFKKEASELKSTFNFLDNADLEKPPEFYFNNLSARINEKTGQRKEKELNFFEKYIFSRKLLIPLIPAVLVIVFLIAKPDTNDNKIAINTFHDSIKTAEKNKTTSEMSRENNINKDIPVLIPEKKTDVKEISRKNEFKQKKVRNESTIKNNETETEGAEMKTENKSEYDFRGSLLADNTADENNADDDTDSELTDDENIDEIIDNDIFDDGDLENEFMELSPQDQNEILETLKKSKI